MSKLPEILKRHQEQMRSAWLSQIVAHRTLNKVTRGRGHLRESRPRGGAQIQQHVIANLHDHIGCTPSP